MKKTLSLLFASCLALSAAAIPARPGTFTVKQKDGTTLTLRMIGDEHFHYFINVDNGKSMLQRADGDFVYTSETELAPLRAAADSRRAQVNERRTARLAKYTEAAGIATTPAQLTAGPHKVIAGEFNGAMKGSKKGLVILMDFHGVNHLDQC